jgi:hypothetical protein
MSLSSLSAKTDFTYDGRPFSRGRRAHLDAVESKGAQPMSSQNLPPKPFDAAFYASRFKADLSQLKAFPKSGEDFHTADPADAEGDRVLYDFFGNLSVLLVSVRAGNLERARAAADALELEVMVESSAGGRAAPGRPNMLDDLKHLLNAAQSGDETAARAAAQDLARDVKQTLEPRGFPAPDPGAPDLDATGAAYEALVAYIDVDTQTAA